MIIIWCLVLRYYIFGWWGRIRLNQLQYFVLDIFLLYKIAFYFGKAEKKIRQKISPQKRTRTDVSLTRGVGYCLLQYYFEDLQ